MFVFDRIKYKPVNACVKCLRNTEKNINGKYSRSTLNVTDVCRRKFAQFAELFLRKTLFNPLIFILLPSAV